MLFIWEGEVGSRWYWKWEGTVFGCLSNFNRLMFFFCWLLENYIIFVVFYYFVYIFKNFILFLGVYLFTIYDIKFIDKEKNNY